MMIHVNFLYLIIFLHTQIRGMIPIPAYHLIMIQLKHSIKQNAGLVLISLWELSSFIWYHFFAANQTKHIPCYNHCPEDLTAKHLFRQRKPQKTRQKATYSLQYVKPRKECSFLCRENTCTDELASAIKLSQEQSIEKSGDRWGIMRGRLTSTETCVSWLNPHPVQFTDSSQQSFLL